MRALCVAATLVHCAFVAAAGSYIAFAELHPGNVCARAFDGAGVPTARAHCAPATNLDIIVPSAALNATSRRYLLTAISGASLPAVLEFDADTGALVQTVSLSDAGGGVSYDPFGLTLDRAAPPRDGRSAQRPRDRAFRFPAAGRQRE